MKTCSKCGLQKDYSCFGKQGDKKDGFCAQCKQCQRERSILKKDERSLRDSAYRQKNAELIRQKDRARYLKNRMEILEKKRIYTAKNAEQKKQYNALYRENNKESIAAQQKEYHQKNRTQRLANHKEYVAANKALIQNQNQKWKNDKYKNDELYAFQLRIKNLIKAAFRNKGFTRRSRIQSILGCSYAEFVLHIESLFIDGMSWDNKGDWHIDHIVPLASATTEENLILLNNFMNLRPLWAMDNLYKGSKMPTNIECKGII